MLVCRYLDDGRARSGHVRGDRVVPVGYDADRRRWVPEAGDGVPLSSLTLLAPAEPAVIVGVALNHDPRRRTRTAVPAVVLKPPSSVVAPGGSIVHPGAPWELWHEAELAVVIGAHCRDVHREHAADVVAGYTCANDVTAYARHGDGQPAWAKHFDATTALGPWIATDLDPATAEITCRVDGRVRQHGSTRDLVRSVPELVADITRHTTLRPGDVILTGTPAGSGPLEPGSSVEVSVTGIGTLHNVIGTRSAVDHTRNGAPARSG